MIKNIKNNLVGTLLLLSCLGTTAVNAAVTLPKNTSLANEQILRLNLGANPTSLDPNVSSDILSSHVLGNMFEPLTRAYSDDGQIIPAAAQSWKVNKNFTVWTFKLRKNAKWSNGQAVTAHDFVYAWKRLADPKTASANATLLVNLDIINAKDIIAGKKTTSELGIRAVDNYTFEIKTNNSIPWLPSLVSSIFLSPVPKATIEKYGREWVKPQNIVVNGPFALNEFIPNEKVTLNKNTSYWNAKNVVITNVKFSISGNDDVIYNRFLANDLDVVYASPRYDKLLKAKNIPITIVPGFNVFAIQLNQDNPKLKDIKVRKALQLAIDSKILVDKVLKSGTATASWTPSYVIDADAIKQPEYFNKAYSVNIAEAKKLIKEAGYSKLNPLKLDFLMYSYAKQAVIAYTNQIKQALDSSVQFNLVTQEWGVYLETMGLGKYDLAYKVGLPTYNHASDYLGIFTSTSSSNNSGYKNSEYDNLYLSSLKAKSDKERKNIYAKLDNMLARDVVVISSVWGTLNMIMNPKLKGSTPTMFGTFAEDFYFVK